MKLNSLKISLPKNFNIILIKKNHNFMIIKNNLFKFIFVNKNKFYINKNLNFILYINKNLNIFKFKFKNIFKKSFFCINNYFFYKIKFKGKGFKIRFYKKKIMNFFFGKSHKNIFIFKNIILKKLSKYKFIIIKNNYETLKKLSINITKIKKINDYTNRGIRLSKQFILKRKGKKGSFI